MAAALLHDEEEVKTSTNAPTKAQLERFDLLHEIGCIVCSGFLQQWRAADISHPLAGGIRIGHDATIPECCWHHRGVPPDGYTERTARRILGPSRAHGSKPYEDAFADDAWLRTMTAECIAKLQSMKRGLSGSHIRIPMAAPVAINAGAWTIVGSYAVKTKSFGIAKRIADDRPAGAGGIIGTVEWMQLDEFEKVSNA